MALQSLDRCPTMLANTKAYINTCLGAQPMLLFIRLSWKLKLRQQSMQQKQTGLGSSCSKFEARACQGDEKVVETLEQHQFVLVALLRMP